MALALAFGAACLLPVAASTSTPMTRARLVRVGDSVTAHPAPVLRHVGITARKVTAHAGLETAFSAMGLACAVACLAAAFAGRVRREWWRFVRSRRGPPVVIALAT
jgi:hypothetical protein